MIIDLDCLENAYTNNSDYEYYAGLNEKLTINHTIAMIKTYTNYILSDEVDGDYVYLLMRMLYFISVGEYVELR